MKTIQYITTFTLIVFLAVYLAFFPLAFSRAEELEADPVSESIVNAEEVAETPSTSPEDGEVVLESESEPEEDLAEAEEETPNDEVATTTLLEEDEQLATTTEEVVGEDEMEEEPGDDEATTSASVLSENDLETPAPGSATIVSGDSIALANVLNLVNSSFVNSDGVVLFSNFFETVFGAIDLRQYFENMLGFGCSLVGCQGEHVAVNISNNATITNDIAVSAVSGNNTIDGVQHGSITSGDAYAGLNLVNVANTSLIDSNYLLVTMNAFQGVNGDIVFPSLSDFFSTLAGGATTPQSIGITNTASVNNDLTLGADSGSNTTSHTGSGNISTGSAGTSGNVFNQLNSSLIGGQSVSVVFRVHGSWAGEVFGAPEGLEWTVGDDGSIYLFDAGQGSGGGSLSMTGSNNALINNNVSVVALTGENAITNAETAVISTGNAYAGANIINVANANVVGRNWILAVINIFGDFNGNIAFGRPDLWVGGQVDVPQSVQNGSELTYKFTILNNGDSPATNVAFENELNGEYLDIVDSSVPFSKTAEGDIRWNIGTIPPGAGTEIEYTAKVQNTGYETEIMNTASLEARETDNNAADNREVLAVSTMRKPSGNGVRIELQDSRSLIPKAEAATEAPVLKVSRLTRDSLLTSEHNVATQKLFVSNTSKTTIKNVVLHDILKDPLGKVVQDEVWEIGDVLPGEEIEIGYQITFSELAGAGRYTLDTQVTGESYTREFLQNGSIFFEKIALVESPLAFPEVLPYETNIVVSDKSTETVTEGREEEPSEEETVEDTPFISPLLPQVANAAEYELAAAAARSGFQLPFGVGLPLMIVIAAVLTIIATRVIGRFV